MSKIYTVSIPSVQSTRAEILAKIAALEAVLAILYDSAAVSAGNATTILYDIDSGQTKQRVEYTTPHQVILAIDGYEKLIQKLRNRLTPRSFRMMDGRSLM